jgi:hypothetical protein
MAYRLYITPVIGSGVPGDSRRPKYIADLGVSWAAMDYGFQPIFLVAANVTPAQHTALITNSDLTAFPADLATNVGGGGVTTAQNALEAAFIPAQWVNGAMRWSEVARIVAGMFQFMQRLNVVLGNEVLIDTSAKLNVQWQAIPANYQTAITEAALSLGYTFNPAPTDQLRALLKNLSDQWGDKSFQLNELVF